MFARVITAQAGPDGFGGTIRLGEQQLPGARQQLETYEVALHG